jgi:hypothetical protein
MDSVYTLPDTPEAPVFYPTVEEFSDPFRYIASIRDKAEHAGMLKIVPPSTWKCPCPIKDKGDFHFQTCVQPVDQLQRRHGPSAQFISALRRFNRRREVFMADEVAPYFSSVKLMYSFDTPHCADSCYQRYES